MLPPQHRMRRSEDFTDAVRTGARRGTARLVVHFKANSAASSSDVLAGLVVSKAVGNAVERNLVKRRLRGLLSTRIEGLGNGAKVVVRALPAARGASSAALAGDLDHALGAVRGHRSGARQ